MRWKYSLWNVVYCSATQLNTYLSHCLRWDHYSPKYGGIIDVHEHGDTCQPQGNCDWDQAPAVHHWREKQSILYLFVTTINNKNVSLGGVLCTSCCAKASYKDGLHRCGIMIKVSLQTSLWWTYCNTCWGMLLNTSAPLDTFQQPVLNHLKYLQRVLEMLISYVYWTLFQCGFSVN